jgi:methionine biosynthesis protein MetW
MKIDSFYERSEVIHEVVESERSEICFDLINNLASKETSNATKSKVLDVGCGDGSFIIKLEKKCRIFGVDVSSRAVEMAKEAGVSAYKSDVSQEKLPFENEYFDLVYLGDLIEHLINPDFAINEVARVTKLNGFLIISTPNLASWLNRMLLVLGFQPLSSEVSTIRDFGRPRIHRERNYLPVGHLRLFTLLALKEFLAYYGFRIVEVRGSGCELHSKMLDIIDNIFGQIPALASIIIIVARKDSSRS